MSDFKIGVNALHLTKYLTQSDHKSNNFVENSNQNTVHLEQLNGYGSTVLHYENQTKQLNRVDDLAQKIQNGEYTVNLSQLVDQILAEHEF